jgi:hypothetical protein
MADAVVGNVNVADVEIHALAPVHRIPRARGPARDRRLTAG